METTTRITDAEKIAATYRFALTAIEQHMADQHLAPPAEISLKVDPTTNLPHLHVLVSPLVDDVDGWLAGDFEVVDSVTTFGVSDHFNQVTHEGLLLGVRIRLVVFPRKTSLAVVPA